jgi:predicted nucleic acid-binding protein
MNDRIFIDTNIFIYAYFEDNKVKHDRAQHLFKELLSRQQSIIISTQILNEFYSVMTKYKKTHLEIVKYLSEIIGVTNVCAVSLPTVESCISIKGTYGYSWWDSLLLSSALESNCVTIYSEDMQDGQVIESSLRILNPLA